MLSVAKHLPKDEGTLRCAQSDMATQLRLFQAVRFEQGLIVHQL